MGAGFGLSARFSPRRIFRAPHAPRGRVLARLIGVVFVLGQKRIEIEDYVSAERLGRRRRVSEREGRLGSRLRELCSVFVVVAQVAEGEVGSVLDEEELEPLVVETGEREFEVERLFSFATFSVVPTPNT